MITNLRMELFEALVMMVSSIQCPYIRGVYSVTTQVATTGQSRSYAWGIRHQVSGAAMVIVIVMEHTHLTPSHLSFDGNCLKCILRRECARDCGRTREPRNVSHRAADGSNCTNTITSFIQTPSLRSQPTPRNNTTVARCCL